MDAIIKISDKNYDIRTKRICRLLKKYQNDYIKENRVRRSIMDIQGLILVDIINGTGDLICRKTTIVFSK